MEKFECRICHCKQYFPLFQWRLPLAADVKEKPVNCTKYPLEPVMCKECGHVQLLDTLDIDMYKNYLYTPSFSTAFRDYISQLTDFISCLEETDGKRMIEIGSSNGYLLHQMKLKGWDVLGFEPSSILAAEAEKLGIPTKEMYFGSEDSKEFVNSWGTPDVIVIRHVLEHLDNLNDIIEAISSILENGYLIIEVPYLLRIIKEKQFYAFFHEHLSYFSVHILQELLSKHELHITDIQENDLEGGSIVVYAQKYPKRCAQDKINSYLALDDKWCSAENILVFSDESKQQIAKIQNIVENEKKLGRKIAAWGAGQRGCTLLNMCGLTNAQLSYIVDLNENYWWKYVLGSNIQVVPPDYLTDHFVESIMILATGYADEIIQSNSDYLQKGGHFIKIIE